MAIIVEHLDEAIRTIGKQGFFVDEYKGEYSLTAAYEATNGPFYRKWAKKRIGKDKYTDKGSPVKVILGDKKTAVAVLQKVIAELAGEETPF